MLPSEFCSLLSDFCILPKMQFFLPYLFYRVPAMEVLMFLEAILLGLSTGTYCAMYCGPALIPFLCGTEKISYRRNALLTGTFLISRLFVYFALGFFLTRLGILSAEFFDPYFARKLSVYAYIFCGASLLLNSFAVKFPWSKGKCRCSVLKIAGNDFLTAVFTGMAVGLHICAPLWTAIARSVFAESRTSGIFYLLFFYAGTLPFFIPVLGIPFAQKALPAVKRVSRIVQFLLGIYFLVLEGAVNLFFQGNF